MIAEKQSAGEGARAGDTRTTETAEHSAATAMERQTWFLYAMVGALILQSALILFGNDPNHAVWLLALLAAGIGQALFLPSSYAWFGGLAAVVLWVMFRQATGIWIQEELLQSILEVLGQALNVLLAVLYRRGWEKLQQEIVDLVGLREVLVAGEAGTGLLARQVAELRLEEEVDRARQFKRPLGLLLIEVEEVADLSREQVDFGEVFQGVARQLIGASLVHDIPFRADGNRLGLIMPERDWEGLYIDTESIVAALKTASFWDSAERPRYVLRHAKLRFGLGTYQGETAGTIDLMRAAEDSLSVGRDLADIGEVLVTAYAMPATPIVESASGASIRASLEGG